MITDLCRMTICMQSLVETHGGAVPSLIGAPDITALHGGLYSYTCPMRIGNTTETAH